jgi:Cu(I)-responsive transcriptional regulator
MSYPMNIGEAAQAAGLTAKMIRDYEALGLIPQASRSESGYRQYTKRDVDMLRFIRQARSMSFSIKQVEQLLSLWSDTQRESRDVKALAHAHMAELDRKMAELASMKASLEQIVSSCPGDDTADCPILSKLSGCAAPAALAGERRQRPTPAPARAAGSAHTRRETPPYAGLLNWSRALNGGLAAHHA